MTLFDGHCLDVGSDYKAATLLREGKFGVVQAPIWLPGNDLQVRPTLIKSLGHAGEHLAGFYGDMASNKGINAVLLTNCASRYAYCIFLLKYTLQV